MKGKHLEIVRPGRKGASDAGEEALSLDEDESFLYEAAGYSVSVSEKSAWCCNARDILGFYRAI